VLDANDLGPLRVARVGEQRGKGVVRQHAGKRGSSAGKPSYGFSFAVVCCDAATPVASRAQGTVCQVRVRREPERLMTRRARAAGGTCHAHCGVVAIHRSSCQEKRWSTNRRSTKRRSSSDSARSGRLRKRVVAWRWRTGRTRTTGTIRITRVVPPPDGCALRSSRSARNRRSRRTAASRPCSLAPGTRPAGLTQRSLIADAAARLCDPASSRRIAIRESPNDARSHAANVRRSRSSSSSHAIAPPWNDRPLQWLEILGVQFPPGLARTCRA